MAYKETRVYLYNSKDGFRICHFDSLHLLARALGVCVSSVSKAIKLQTKCQGYYVSDEKLEKFPYRNYRRGGQPLLIRNSSSSKWIHCMTLSEAAKITGISRTTLRESTKRRGRTIDGKWHLRFLEKEKITLLPPRVNGKVPVVLEKDGKKYSFESIKEAAETLNLNRMCISHVLSKRCRRTKGYTVKRGKIK